MSHSIWKFTHRNLIKKGRQLAIAYITRVHKSNFGRNLPRECKVIGQPHEG